MCKYIVGGEVIDTVLLFICKYCSTYLLWVAVKNVIYFGVFLGGEGGGGGRYVTHSLIYCG